MKEDYKKAMLTRDSMDESIPSFEEYLKLLQSTPDILGKIRDMKVMDGLLRIFFSNFTITATGKDFRQGSDVVFELKEPWRGFLKNGDFVRLCVHTLRILYGTYLETDIREEEVSVFHTLSVSITFIHRKGVNSIHPLP
jgi:hypothetical protein